MNGEIKRKNLMNIPERERQENQPNTPSESGNLAQPQVGVPYSRLLKPSYMNRWRRSWRPRVWAAGAGALGIIAGAGVIALSHPAQSAASPVAVPVPVYPTATTTPQRLVIPQSGGYDDRWQDDLFNDGSSNPTTTTQQWVNTAPVPAPRSTYVPTYRAPQVTTRSS
jgi:hypothetical protein